MPTGRDLWLLQPRIHQLSETLMTHVLRDGHVAYTDWSEQDWRLARVVGSLHGILAPLGALCAHTPFGPPDWQAFLAEQLQFGLARVARILDLFERILLEFEHGAVDVMPLKGADLLTRVYPAPAIRSTSDIDLLVRRADFERAAHLLGSMGFDCTSDSGRHAVFMLPHDAIVTSIGEHPANPVKVELHRAATVAVARSSIDITAPLWREAAVETWRGRRVLRPSLAALTAHVLLHAAADMQFQSFRGFRLFDVMHLGARLSDADWQRLVSVVSEAGGSHLAYAALMLTRRYAPVQIPDRVLAAFVNGTSAVLRRHMATTTLSALSYCSVRSSVVLDQLKWATGPRYLVDVIFASLYPSKAQRQTWTGSVRQLGYVYGFRQYYARLAQLLARQKTRPSIERIFALID